jgi:hypothetical protein
MKVQVLIDVIKSGKKPMVRLLDEVYESWGQKGMIAEITSAVEHKHGFELTFDYSCAKEANLALEDHGYFIWENGVDTGKTGTALEAGMREPDEFTEDFSLDPEDDIPVEMIDLDDMDSPMTHYLRHKATFPDNKQTYVEFLEGQFRAMAHEHMHPTAEEAGLMTVEQACHLMQERIYKTACVAERFEVGCPQGQVGCIFLGNGHHFAQKVAETVKQMFVAQLKERTGNPLIDGRYKIP